MIMSYTEMFVIGIAGTVRSYSEYHNSHRGAMLVWCNLYKAYCKDYIKEKNAKYHMDWDVPVSNDDFNEVWALFHRPDVPRQYRIVLGATFDNVILLKENFSDYIAAVEYYAESYSCGTLLQQCKDIEKLKKRKIIGVCWNQTSVNSDTWQSNNKRSYYSIYKEGKDVVWTLFDNIK
jgi:hypothetical protein